jgi:hypothetical protein
MIPTKKHIIQHFVLNLFTVLNAEISDLDINAKKKSKIMDLIKIASVIIAYEKIFLDEKIELFVQDVSLDEIIKLICAIHKEDIQKNKIKIKFANSDISLKTDKHYLNEALKYIIYKLVKNSSFINFDYDSKKKILKIMHDIKDLNEGKYTRLSECLTIHGITFDEIQYQLALNILKMLNAEIEFKPNELNIQFN